MNKEWADKFREIKALIGKKDTFDEGINKLIDFRGELLAQISNIVENFSNEAFSMRPFAKAKGFHNLTLAYSIWHIFRIEDIVAHELIARTEPAVNAVAASKSEQVLFAGGYQKLINSPIITTGNELVGEEIVEFSKKLNIMELLNYVKAVTESTNEILRSLSFAECKRKFGEADKERIARSKCVSESEEANWLIDYWCSKNINGLILMPFSRHWIMHIEAMLRIKNKLYTLERKMEEE